MIVTDVFVLVLSVYFYSIAGQFKTFIDCPFVKEKENKDKKVYFYDDDSYYNFDFFTLTITESMNYTLLFNNIISGVLYAFIIMLLAIVMIIMDIPLQQE